MRTVVALLALTASTGCLTLSPYTRLPGEDTATTDTAVPDDGTDTDPADSDPSDTDPADTDPVETDTEDSDPVETDTEDTEPEVQAETTVLITEIMDSSSSGSMKWVELHNPGSEPLPLQGWTLALYTNGDTSSSQHEYEFTSEVLPAGGFVVVANNGSSMTGQWGNFALEYGQMATVYASVANGNGDDVYAIRNPNDLIVDVYGVVGVDGSNEPWDYTNATVKRDASVVTPTAFFDASEWWVFNNDTSSLPFDRN